MKLKGEVKERTHEKETRKQQKWINKKLNIKTNKLIIIYFINIKNRGK